MRSNVIHLITPYLFHTGSWVYSQISGTKGYNSYVFTQKKENLDQFPIRNIISVEDFGFVRRKVSDFAFKFTGNYGIFYKKYLKDIKPFLFHAHMGYEAARWLKFIEKTNIPLITTFYGMDVSSLGKIPYWLNRYKKLFEYGCIFLAEGTHLKKQLVMLGCPEEKIIVQHLGVDMMKYLPKGEYDLSSNKTVLLQTSTFREKKGIEYSFKAVALLKEKGFNIEFRLIGAGDNNEIEKKYRNLVANMGICDNVYFLGKKTHQETIAEMSKADIFIHPSIIANDGDNEGGAPVGVIEASALGLPIISTYHADIPEVVIHNKTGLLTEEKNIEGLLYNLVSLIENKELRKSMGCEGRKHVEREYNLAIQLEKLEKIYSMLAK